jgi:hypothetical protein
MHLSRSLRKLAFTGSLLAMLALNTATAAAGPPRGYVERTSGLLTFPSGFVAQGMVNCPKGLVPLGGGTLISTPSVLTAVSGSFPSGTGWVADVNNLSGGPVTFIVEVLCARRPARYRVVTSTFANPANSRSTITASCPRGSRPIGGGGRSGTFSLNVNLSSTLPVPQLNGWRADQNNLDVTDTQLTAYAVCARLPGYAVVRGTELANPAGQRTGVTVACPDPTVPVGGGIEATRSPSFAIAIGSTLPVAASWTAFLHNDSGVDASAQAVAVCAGT